MTSTQEEAMVAQLKLREDNLAKFRRLAGIKTDDALAKRMGVDPATVHRVLRNKSVPGPRFIAGLMDVFGTECFSDLFELVNDDGTEDAA